MHIYIRAHYFNRKKYDTLFKKRHTFYKYITHFISLVWRFQHSKTVMVLWQSYIVMLCYKCLCTICYACIQKCTLSISIAENINIKMKEWEGVYCGHRMWLPKSRLGYHHSASWLWWYSVCTERRLSYHTTPYIDWDSTMY